MSSSGATRCCRTTSHPGHRASSRRAQTRPSRPPDSWPARNRCARRHAATRCRAAHRLVVRRSTAAAARASRPRAARRVSRRSGHRPRVCPLEARSRARASISGDARPDMVTPSTSSDRAFPRLASPAAQSSRPDSSGSASRTSRARPRRRRRIHRPTGESVLCRATTVLSRGRALPTAPFGHASRVRSAPRNRTRPSLVPSNGAPYRPYRGTTAPSRG